MAAAPRRRGDWRGGTAGFRRPVPCRRAVEYAARIPTHPLDGARDLLYRRAVTGDHSHVGAVRRHGAVAPGLRDAQALWCRRATGNLGRARAGARIGTGYFGVAVRGPCRIRDHRRNRAYEDNGAAGSDGDDGRGSVGQGRRAAVLGGVISMPLLAALFSVAGIFGGYLVGVRLIGIDAGAFWGQMQAGVDFWPDVTNGIIKSVVFGAAVSLISVFEGYNAKPTAEGVASATTRTVVLSSLAILALDFVMTAFMFRGGNAT